LSLEVSDGHVLGHKVQMMPREALDRGYELPAIVATELAQYVVSY